METECTGTKAETSRTTLKRLPQRASFDRAALDEILDTAVICHLGFTTPDGPVVIPTIHARHGDTLYLHGSVASRMLRTLAGGVDACATVTLIDGLVLSKSWFHHSMNYRSAVIFGRARIVADPEAKREALRVIVEHVRPGRTTESRPPTPKELAATIVLAQPLTEWSVKSRTGPAIEDPGDEELPWTNGVVPVPAARFGG
jgi:nitroimidazol reductase NimA-like FMN-containing flavoprotein (pyridoxamine 5'-phosphate oxidase superfamily)